MESITVGQCFRGAWRDAGSAILNRPVMALIMFALLLVTSYAQLELRLAIAATAAAGGPRAGHPGASSAIWMCSLLQLFAISGLSVQVMRYCLLGAEVSRSIDFFNKGFWLYVGLCALLGLVVAAVTVVGVVVVVFTLVRHVHGGPLAVLALVLITPIVACVAVFIFMRLSLLLSHAAIKSQVPWRAAWRDTRGHFWSILTTHIVTALPLIGTAILFAVIKRKTVGNVTTDDFIYWSAVGAALWMIISISLSAACSAWLYRRFAATILDTA
jgi:hypothetical protein